jgi:uncharacterized protein Yka (UPF0111/DUF47 family)
MANVKRRSEGCDVFVNFFRKRHQAAFSSSFLNLFQTIASNDGIRLVAVFFGRQISLATPMLIRAGKQYLGQLEILSAFIYECGAELERLLAGAPVDRGEIALKIRDAERSAHERSKQLITQLNQAPIKPLDEKTVRDLAIMQSEILRGIAKASNRFVLYQIGEPGAFLHQLSQKLLHQATLIKDVFAGILKGDSVLGQCEEIIHLDDEVERTLESCMLQLFASEKDPIEVIKRKQILDEFQVLAEKVRRIADFVKSLAIASTAAECPHKFWRRRGV